MVIALTIALYEVSESGTCAAAFTRVLAQAPLPV